MIWIFYRRKKTFENTLLYVFLDKKVVVEKLRPHRKLLKDFYSDEKDQPSDKGEII